MFSPDVVGMVVGVVLTLMVFSYLVGDNPLYRIALYLFVGCIIGYSLGIVIREVFIARVMGGLLGRDLGVVVPLVLGLLLLGKGISVTSRIGTIPLAFLVGVGTAVALGGAIVGTIVPQVAATGESLAFRSFGGAAVTRGLLIVIGTVCTLLVFNNSGQKREGLGALWGSTVRTLSGVGRIFLICALATAFAGAVTTALTVFVGRSDFIIKTVVRLGELLGI
jgi:hypothetical protein